MVGIDISLNSLKQSEVAFIQMDGENLAFKNEVFSNIVAKGSLECIDIEKAIREMSRVLKPKGKLVFTFQWDNRCVRFYRRYFRPEHPKDKYFATNQYKLNYIKRLLDKNKLKLRKKRLVGYGAIWEIECVKRGK